jgi:hypothetical protein
MATLDQLKEDLASDMDAEQVFQKHVVDGSSYYFSLADSNINDEYCLRQDIARACQASINDVVIIGSAKLGFSVKDNSFREFDSKFQETGRAKDRSDVDLAIVNSRLFETVTEEIFHLSCHFQSDWIKQHWQTNQYYLADRKLFREYTKYLARGWLRPDFLPNVYLSEVLWRPACTHWSAKLGRNVNVGIYSNWTYLKHYHMDHLEVLRAKLKTAEKTI